MFKIGASVLVAAIFLFTIFGSFYTIDQGEVGVVLTNGAISSDSGPGLHFKMPWVQSVEIISTQIQRDAFEYVNATTDHRMIGYTKDQQQTWVAMSINYHVTNPNEVYSKFGSVANMENRVIDPRANEQVRNILGQFSAQQAIDDRTRFNLLVTSAITKAIDGPVVVDSVQVEDIKFSSQFEQAVEQRMQAIIAQQRAEAEKAKTMVDADAQKYKTEAAADATLYAGQAEAKAIQAKGEALRNNPDIVALTAAQKWNGELPSTMVPGGALPFLDIKK